MRAMKRYPYIKNAKDNEYAMHEARNMIDPKMKNYKKWYIVSAA